MSRKVYDFRKRSNQPRAIDLDDKKASELLHFKDKDNLAIGEENTITLSVLRLVKVADKVRCEGIVYEVLRIEEELPDMVRKGFVLQKLIVRRFR